MYHFAFDISYILYLYQFKYREHFLSDEVEHYFCVLIYFSSNYLLIAIQLSYFKKYFKCIEFFSYFASRITKALFSINDNV